ncbi:MAG: carbonic anhydrase family protein [bacterium]|nr:carbonic anhydrase family protein [bacterium]
MSHAHLNPIGGIVLLSLILILSLIVSCSSSDKEKTKEAPPTTEDTAKEKNQKDIPGAKTTHEEGHESNEEPVTWSYNGETGPQHWGNLKPEYAMCKDGKSQSPIDISTTVAADLGDIQFNYQDTGLKIINNGHTIQVEYQEDSSIKIKDKTYKLKQFHFHSPSENTRNGNAYDMEMHLVHEDSEGQLAVVGVFMTQGNEHPHIKILWDNMPREAVEERELPEVLVNAAKLLPENGSYFHFDGSLTTPPCTEGVKWYVLKTPIEVSEEQVKLFLSVIGPSARPVQPLHGRTVLEVTRENISLSGTGQ